MANPHRGDLRDLLGAAVRLQKLFRRAAETARGPRILPKVRRRSSMVFIIDTLENPFRALRITIVVLAVLVLLWWFGMRMPGKNVSKAGPLSPDEVVLREELRANVQKLAGEIGERNMWHYAQLNAAADFIEDSFSRAGLRTRRDSYEMGGQSCHNIEAEIPGNSRRSS